MSNADVIARLWNVVSVFALQYRHCQLTTRDVSDPNCGTVVVYVKSAWYPALLGWQWVDFGARDVIGSVRRTVLVDQQEIAVVVGASDAVELAGVWGRWVEERLLGDKDFVDRFRVSVVIAFC